MGNIKEPKTNNSQEECNHMWYVLGSCLPDENGVPFGYGHRCLKCGKEETEKRIKDDAIYANWFMRGEDRVRCAFCETTQYMHDYFRKKGLNDQEIRTRLNNMLRETYEEVIEKAYDEAIIEDNIREQNKIKKYIK